MGTRRRLPRRSRVARRSERLEPRNLLAGASLEIVRDINALTGSSLPRDFAEVGDSLVFIAQSRLWKLDAGAEAPVQIGDNAPEFLDLSPVANQQDLVKVGEQLLFFGSDAEHGSELWRTDATSSGTQLVLDIRPGSASGPTAEATLHVSGSRIYFAANDGVSGTELWTSDGTPEGTQLLVDLLPGSGSSDPSNFVEFNGQTYFSVANDALSQPNLWRTDGTTAGTVPVFNGASPSFSNFSNPTVVGSQLFFTATGLPSAGQELWKTDGTAGGTSQVVDLHTESGRGSQPFGLVNLNGVLIFAANGMGIGDELFRSDGTAAGTQNLQDSFPGLGPSAIRLRYRPMVLGDSVVYQAQNGSSGLELWSTDGTPQGTGLLADVRPGHETGVEALAGVHDGALWFVGNTASHGRELWKSDGTAQGTWRVTDVVQGPGHGLPVLEWDHYEAHLTTFDGKPYFRGESSTTGIELWTTDTWPTGAHLVADIDETTGSADPESGKVAGDVLYFWADDGHGPQLTRSDGTAAGTYALPAPGLQAAAEFTQLGSLTIFAGTTASHGKELWVTDGTATGTQLLADIRSGAAASSPTGFYAHGGRLYFSAHGPSGVELWKTNGTTAGTELAREVQPGAGSSDPSHLQGLGSGVYFWANDGSAGVDLWSTNSSTKIWNFATNDAIRSPIVVLGDRLYFLQDDGQHGVELWSSGGTTATTGIVADFNPGAGDGFRGASPLSIVNDRLLMSDGATAELVASDGTSFEPLGLPSSQTVAVSPDHSMLFFRSWSAGASWLARTDGTVAGTILLAELDSPARPVWHEGTLYFTARTNELGTELWKSDGTPVGTQLVGDFNPGPGNSPYKSLFSAGGKLLTFYQDAFFGTELFEVVERLPGDANGDGFVTGADYTIWADHFGLTGATFDQGDFNGDGLVSGADYTIWSDHFGGGEEISAVIPPTIPSSPLAARPIPVLDKLSAPRASAPLATHREIPALVASAVDRVWSRTRRELRQSEGLREGIDRPEERIDPRADS